MRILVLVMSTALLVTGCVVTPSVRSMLVGSPACPRLNAHKKNACRFKRGGHGFQVWPERIRLKKTSVSGVYQVTHANLGDDDLMFDHTLRFKKDDHVAFDCFIRTSDGTFIGPLGFRINKGGVWETYGDAVIAFASALASGGGKLVGQALVKKHTIQRGNKILEWTFGGAFGAAGGLSATYLGSQLSTLGDRSWKKQAGQVAVDICRTLATKMKRR